MKKPDMANCSEASFMKWFWEEENSLCSRCTNNCKQSSKVDLQCTKYIKK